MAQRQGDTEATDIRTLNGEVVPDDGGAPTGVAAVEPQPAGAQAGPSGQGAPGGGPPGGAAPRQPGSRLTLILIVCCVAQFMVILDLSIVNVALPSIQSSLNFTSADLQWVVDAYAITFAGFLMLGGRAADHLGQRRVFVAALLLFSVASLVGGAAVNREMLIGARALQGFSCAFMAASSLAIITSSFPPGPQLHRAVGLWAAMNGAGGAAGVLFGGIITEAISWRWVLLINPPIGLVAALVAWAVVADRRRESAPGFDLAGALTLTIGQIVLVYGVVKAGVNGWSAGVALGPILAGFALLGVFCLIETRIAKWPLVPFKELTKPLRTANTIVVLFSAALFPMWYLSSLYLQQVLGLSPLHAGLAFLPMALTIMVVARTAGKLVSRFGVRAVLGSGLTMMACGMLLFTKIAASGSSVVYVIIPGLLTAAGIGMSIVPSTIAATQGAKPGQAGLASGLVNTSRQIGGGLGIAVLITLATQHSTHLIGNGQAVPQALTDGFRLGYYIAAGLVVAAAVVTFLAVPKPAAQAQERPTRRLQIAGIVVAVIATFVVVDFAVGGGLGAPIGAYTTKDTYSFVTQPGLHPPVIRADVVPKDASQLPQGDIFLTNFYDLTQPPIAGQSGPLILDNHLGPLWFKPVSENVVASNLSLQRYQGKPALSWWQGNITNAGATTSGEDVIVNQHYQTLAKVRGVNGWLPTLHEIIVRGNYAWVTANKNVPMNLSKWGGAYNGALIDSAVQEYNIKTGKLVYDWDALKHIPLDDSYATLPTNGFPWDAYHVNSINLTADGGFIVSMRNTWAVYKVARSGRIVWTLGGKHSDFKFGPRANFAWQHDVVVHPDSTLTMFDDHCCQITGGGTYVSPSAPSRGLRIKLNQRTRTATFATEYSHGTTFDADYMGSTQPLPSGDVFVGWGSQPFFSKFDRHGKLVFDAVLPRHNLSYRTTVERWVGLPLYPPVGAARTSGGKATVYASWNGATEVASWRVLAGTSGGALVAVATIAKSGFETPIPVRGTYKDFRVQALDANGRVLGTSRVFSG